MAGSFNPKMLAQDIAKGGVYLKPSKLKKYTSEDLAAIVSQLTIVRREVRARRIPVDQLAEVKKKNRQLQSINQAVTIINGYVKKHGLRV
jgi:hypothetical protein